MTKRFVTITTALLAVLAAAASASQTATSKVMAALQGTWVLTVENGQDMAGSGTEVLFTVKGNEYTQSANGQIVERGSFKIDETKKPMTVDVTIAEGDNAGTTQLGLLELTGDTLQGKFSAPGATTRPTDFAPADGYTTFTARKK